MADRDRFLAAVRTRAEGTPYVVEPTASGFDVRVEVADATWYAPMYEAGVRKVFTHHVALGEGDRYSVTDDGYEVEWQGGAESGAGGAPRPVLRAQAERQTGTVREFSFRKQYAWNEQGEYGEVVSYTFSSGEGNQLIRAAAEELGLKQTLPGTSKVALVIAVIGALGALVALVTLGLLALSGRL